MLKIESYCDQCASCVAVCPTGALSMGEFKVKVDHSLCTECEICVKICPLAALEVINEK